MDQSTRILGKTGGLALTFASAVAFIGIGGVAKADRIGIANQAAFGNGVIESIDLDTHTVLGSFIPDGAKLGTNNGRGVQLFLGSNLVYYTELTNGFGSTDFIRVAPYNNGAGGADITHFANPVPGTGVVDLASDGHGHLFVMTGYPNGPEVVQETDGVGNNIGGQITLHTTRGATLSASDGFTILANGNFLINDDDAVNSYNQYNPITGAEISGTTIQAHTTGGALCGLSTGVSYYGPSNTLFFDCNLSNMVEDTRWHVYRQQQFRPRELRGPLDRCRYDHQSAGGAGARIAEHSGGGAVRLWFAAAPQPVGLDPLPAESRVRRPTDLGSRKPAA